MSKVTFAEAEQALETYRRYPRHLGACIRAVRFLDDGGYRAEAHSVACAFAARGGSGEAGGDALLAFVQRAPTRRYAAGESIIAEGTGDDTVYVLLRGDARVRRLGVGELAIIPPGSVVGEIAALTGTARTASVYARGEVAALEMSPGALAELARRMPGVYPSLREVTRERLVSQLMGPGSVFGGIGKPERAALFEQCLAITFAEGTLAVREGEAGKALCIIASGMAHVWHGDVDDKHVIAALGPGEVFGEVSLVFDRVATATVEAITPLTCFALAVERFEETMRRFPSSRDRVTAMARERLEADDHIELSRPPAPKL